MSEITRSEITRKRQDFLAEVEGRCFVYLSDTSCDMEELEVCYYSAKEATEIVIGLLDDCCFWPLHDSLSSSQGLSKQEEALRMVAQGLFLLKIYLGENDPENHGFDESLLDNQDS